MSHVLDALPRKVIGAPMAGGPGTPALAAAISEAGGLGFLPAGYRTATQVDADLAALRQLTGKPFGVNVFLPGGPVDEAAVRGYAAALAGDAARWGVALGDPVGGDDDYPAKVELLTQRRIPVVSFAFGLPDPEVVGRLHDAGTEVWVTVTHPAAAAEAAAVGVDAIVVQGTEAGAHRGGADDTDDYGLLPLLRLAASRTALPLVAAGGIGDGPTLAAALVAGAAAAQVGTAFLRSPEAGTAQVQRDAVGDTRLTRAFTGRRARGVVNDFMRRHDPEAPPGYPHIHQLTQPIRAAARAAGDPEAVNLWAGQAYPLATPVPAGRLVERLWSDALRALAATHGRYA